jgi:hypothetical protein
VLIQQQRWPNPASLQDCYINQSKGVREAVGLDAVNAEALCGQDALRPWELGGMPGPQLYATPLRLTHAAVTFLIQLHEFTCPG